MTNLSGMYLGEIRSQVGRKSLEKYIPGIPSNKELIARLKELNVTNARFWRNSHCLFDGGRFSGPYSYSVKLEGGELQVHTYLDKQLRHVNYSVKLEKLNCFGRKVA